MKVLIVGGGASGVLFAAHFLRRADGHRAEIIEQREELGAGPATSAKPRTRC